MNNLKLLFGKGNSIGQYGMIIALVVIVAFFWFTTDGLILEPTNVINLFLQYSYILILALGMVMVIIAGHIDLSVGSVAAFVGIIVAQSMSVWHWPAWAAIILGLAVGALVGAWQGFWVAFVRVPAFIVTLAGSSSSAVRTRSSVSRPPCRPRTTTTRSVPGTSPTSARTRTTRTARSSSAS